MSSGDLAERDRPPDLAGVEVDGVERAPGRLHRRVALGVEEPVVAEVRVRPPRLRRLALRVVGLRLAQDVRGDGLDLGGREEGERGHDPLALLEERDDVRLLLPVREPGERRELPLRVALAVDAVAHRAVLRVDARARAVPPSPGGGSSSISRIQGISFALTYRSRVSGSKAEPPHSAPPSKPGKIIVPCVLGGTNWPPLRTRRSRSRTAAREAGEMSVASSSVKACRAKAGGFTGTGWVGHARSPFRSDAGTSPLLDREERLARLAVEDEHVARLRGLRDGVDRAPVAPHGHEHGRLRQVAVPQVVAHDLVVPDALAGGRLQGEHAVAEQVRRRAGRRPRSPTPASRSAGRRAPARGPR